MKGTSHSSKSAMRPEPLTRLSAVPAMLLDSTTVARQPSSLMRSMTDLMTLKSVSTMPPGFLALHTLGLTSTCSLPLSPVPPSSSTLLRTAASTLAPDLTTDTLSMFTGS